MMVGDLVIDSREYPRFGSTGIIIKIWDETKHRAGEPLYSIIWQRPNYQSARTLNKEGELKIVSNRRLSTI
jgi:hypothetical protein